MTLLASAIIALAGVATAQPLFLYSVDGDNDTMIRVDVTAVNPVVELLGTVVAGGTPVPEMEAMTWDRDFGRFIVVSNAGFGPLYRIDPDDITAPPPANIPASFVGNTNTIQMEGIALHPGENVYYAVDNTSDPSKLVKVSRITGQVIQVVGELRDAANNPYNNMEGLAFTFGAPFILYGANNPGEGPSTLYTINLTTGQVTAIGTGIGFVNVECLVFAPNGTLYGFSNGNGAGDFFITIDATTGVGTLFNVINAMSFDIEGCTFLDRDSRVAVQGKSWSNMKQLYRTP